MIHPPFPLTQIERGRRMTNCLEVSRHTSLFFQQVFFLMVIPQLWWFDVCGHLWVDVMTVTDVVHSAATARDDALNLLSLVHLGWLVPVYRHGEGEVIFKRARESVSAGVLLVWSANNSSSRGIGGVSFTVGKVGRIPCLSCWFTCSGADHSSHSLATLHQLQH